MLYLSLSYIPPLLSRYVVNTRQRPETTECRNLTFQEHLLDSKKDVDRRLKAVCEQFIADTSQGMLRSVQEINGKVATFQAMRADKQAKLSSQPWADTNILTTAVTETVKLIKQNVGGLILFVDVL